MLSKMAYRANNFFRKSCYK